MFQWTCSPAHKLMSYLNSRPRFTLILTRWCIVCYHSYCIYPETKRLLQGSAGQIIEIGNLLCSLFWIHIIQELHHLNWNWLCVVRFVLMHRHLPHGDWDWWEATMALRRRGAAGNTVFDIDGDGGHGCTCKIGC